MTEKQYIQFFDTTLRDGEQTPGVNFNTKEKVQIALQMEKWGIDVIEAGFPISSEGDFEAVKAIAGAVKNMTVAGLARCNEKDIDAAYDALRDAVDPQIHIFIATSPIHMEFKLKMSKEEVLASVAHHIAYAKSKFEKVQFSPEDATRSDWDFLVEVINLAIEKGATVINIPDTVGYTNPTEFGNLFKYLKQNVTRFDDVIFSSHCHDDLGMATANALAAVENGALRVEGTINGIGERAGNTALEEVAVALHIRKSYYEKETGMVLKETKRTSDLVSRLSGMPIPRNKAVIGGNAYAHESGIHQDGVLKNPETYEIITPQLVGVEHNSLPLGKLSGRHAFVDRIAQMGYEISDPAEIKILFARFKELADKKKNVTEEDIHALMVGKSIEDESVYELKRLQVQFVKDGIQGAIVGIQDKRNKDAKMQDSATGSGSIEAIYNTINRILDQEIILKEYNIEAITGGKDAQAEVHVVVEDEDGKSYNGTGIDFDVLTASAKAYIQASGKAKNKQTIEKVSAHFCCGGKSKMNYTIAALPGDGIGPEIMESGLTLLETIGKKFQHEFNVTVYPFGGAGIDETGDPIPPQTIKGCSEADAILLAAIGGPKWEKAETTPEDGLLQLRKTLGLFSNIRPISVSDSIAHLSPLKTERVKGTDFIVVRELTGGLYFGQPKHWNDEEATDTLFYKKSEIDRIVRQAFDIAMTRSKKLTSVDKANVLASSKLWRKTVNEIAMEYPEVTVDHLYVDAASMKIIQDPTAFDVIVTENMFGDILSDEASVITGSLGMLPSGSHAVSGPSLYEPIHGSAPDIAGKNIANPMSMILSVAMMLRQSFQLHVEADALEKAAAEVMDAGFLTADLGGTTTTTAFTEQVKAILEK